MPADQKSLSPGNQALEGTWEADYVSGSGASFDSLFPNRKPTIIFNLSENKVSGNGGCNNFHAGFSMEGNNIKFQQPASTRMACPGNGEQLFFKALLSVTKFGVTENTLNLIADDIAVMRLQRKAVDSHTSQSSVDWPGNYRGVIPCADCPGIEITLRLNSNNTYEMQQTYLERNIAPITSSGNFSWLDNGSKIVLDSEKDKRRFQVGENRLFWLDQDGKRITGALADKYVLTKQ
ncbi:copper resistance protein NlpE N-terminal domain-containing protein [Flavihumibacter solisilvae]|uniref:copper resistance protein NlpE N-terminal domain-containing protein n=1 Tax=Flavihumibacter solisilvae TaxID=1349421 RepID=UPI001364CF9F|nr:copper resistance protein NlpE N-terminal domain-containing protein [Flavihumibacter solisilvae]